MDCTSSNQCLGKEVRTKHSSAITSIVHMPYIALTAGCAVNMGEVDRKIQINKEWQVSLKCFLIFFQCLSVIFEFYVFVRFKQLWIGILAHIFKQQFLFELP